MHGKLKIKKKKKVESFSLKTTIHNYILITNWLCSIFCVPLQMTWISRSLLWSFVKKGKGISIIYIKYYYYYYYNHHFGTIWGENDNSWSCEKKCSGCNGNYVQMIYECAVIIFMFLRILVNSEVI